MKRAVQLKVFDRVEGKRLRNELIHILAEKNPLPPLTLMGRLGIFTALHPALDFNSRTRDLVESVSGVLAWWKYLFTGDRIDSWMVYFLGLTDQLADDRFSDVMVRFSIPPSRAQALLYERARSREALANFARGQVDRPSMIVRTLRGMSIEVLLLMMAKTSREDTRRAMSEYISRLRHVKPILTGKDLIAMGYQPGSGFGLILNALRDAKLDGRVTTRVDEQNIVADLFRSLPEQVETHPAQTRAKPDLRQ
jgi:tRNA nucleotidyltransferase (CCA-adding enzyme)